MSNSHAWGKWCFDSVRTLGGQRKQGYPDQHGRTKSRRTSLLLAWIIDGTSLRREEDGWVFWSLPKSTNGPRRRKFYYTNIYIQYICILFFYFNSKDVCLRSLKIFHRKSYNKRLFPESLATWKYLTSFCLLHASMLLLFFIFQKFPPSNFETNAAIHNFNGSAPT